MEDHCAEYQYHWQVGRRTSEWMGSVLTVLPEGDHTRSMMYSRWPIMIAGGV